ncbi:MAG: type II CRISPR-associated endonuclease Cas1 [Bacillota bacterium]
MAYINIFVENGCKICIEENKLCLFGEKQAKFPIEDINCLLIESQSVQITSYAISQLAKSGCVLLFCDEKHIPNAFCSPFQTHYKRLYKLNLQISVNKPKQKRLWQQFIRCKIRNQMLCLKYLGYKEHENFIELINDVQSGDVTNIEAISARKYFLVIGGNDFSRASDCVLNSALNYTYAIVRAVISRTLVAYGFETSLGIFHKNQYNAFNFSDDIMELFRGIIDYFVLNSIGDFAELKPKLKQDLMDILNVDVLYKEEKHSLNYAIEKVVISLDKFFQSGEIPEFYPKLCGGNGYHRYE